MLSRKNRVLNCPYFNLRAGAVEGQEPTPEAEELFRIQGMGPCAVGKRRGYGRGVGML